MKDDPMQMRPSRVLEKMRSGGVATCCKLNLADPRVAEIAALCGFDAVWLDTEHVPNTLSDIENQVRAAGVHNVDAIVRVKRGSYSDLIYPLEMDAAGVMVPHVMSAQDARQVAWFTRFAPIGRRPVDGGNADGAYCMIPVIEYMKQANERRMVIIQIEDPEPMAELEAIAAVEGLDMLLFGPNDFSHGLGVPGQLDHPKVAEALERIARAARAHGKFAGTVGTAGDFQQLVDMGYQFLNLAADVTSLTESFRSILAAVRP